MVAQIKGKGQPTTFLRSCPVEVALDAGFTKAGFLGETGLGVQEKSICPRRGCVERIQRGQGLVLK